MKKTTSSLITILTFSIGMVHAEESKHFNFMNEKLSEQLLNQTTVLSDPRLIKAQAELLRKHYEALIESGFSKDEALQLVIAMASQDKQ